MQISRKDLSILKNTKKNNESKDDGCGNGRKTREESTGDVVVVSLIREPSCTLLECWRDIVWQGIAKPSPEHVP